MSLQELEKAVAGLTPGELSAFSDWFEEFRADGGRWRDLWGREGRRLAYS